MFQIAGGSIGLGLNTALVVTAGSLVEGSTGRSWWTPCSQSAGWWSPCSSSVVTSIRNGCARCDTTIALTRLEAKSPLKESGRISPKPH
jgi:hypothetical protein